MLPDRRGLEALYIPVYIITIVIYQSVLQNKKTTSIYVKCQNYYCCRVQYFLRNCTKTFFLFVFTPLKWNPYCAVVKPRNTLLETPQPNTIRAMGDWWTDSAPQWCHPRAVDDVMTQLWYVIMKSTETGWCHWQVDRNLQLKHYKTYLTSDSAANNPHATHTHTGTYCTYTYNVFTSKYSFKCADIQRTNTTCLWGCLGLSCSRLSFPNIFLLSLRLNPRSQQPLGDNAPTLPASPIPISTRVSQLAARAWSKPADWRHKTEEGEGEGRTRTETDEGRRSRVFLLSCFSGWQKTNERRGLNGPVNPQTKA